METNVNGNVLSIFLDKEVYSKEVISKCFYWYGGTYDIAIQWEDGRYAVTLTPLIDGQMDIGEIKQLISKVKRDLSEYQLREIVDKETYHIRNLLVAKAFAYYEEEDENPDTEISDPVGFHPLNL